MEGMAKKSEAHYNLDNLFRRVGVPTAIIPDNAPELTHGGDFRKKALMAQCRLKSASGGFGCYFGTTPQFEIPTRPNRNIFRNSQNLFLIA